MSCRAVPCRVMSCLAMLFRAASLVARACALAYLHVQHVRTYTQAHYPTSLPRNTRPTNKPNKRASKPASQQGGGEAGVWARGGGSEQRSYARTIRSKRTRKAHKQEQGQKQSNHYIRSKQNIALRSPTAFLHFPPKAGLPRHGGPGATPWSLESTARASNQSKERGFGWDGQCFHGLAWGGSPPM